VNTFDRHLLREWLEILGLVVAATCGLLLVNVLYDQFRVLREIDASGPEMWKFIGLTMPSYCAVVLPLALLVSLLYALGKLHRANELTAMRVAGVGFIRLTAPIWVVGVVCCGLSWWLNTRVVPWSVDRSELFLNELKSRHEAKTLTSDRVLADYSVAFDNRNAGRMWFFDRYSQFTERAYGVTVSELDSRRRETRRVVAAEAAYDRVRHGWRFRNGRELMFKPETGELVGSKPFATWFAANYDDNPTLMLLTGRKPIDLSLPELSALLDYYRAEDPIKAVPYAVRYYGLIADTLGPLIVIAIAIPFAITGVRVNPAVGVSKSIGLFFLYYLLSNFAASLATKQLVDPLFAAWMPNAGMAAVALWFFVRLR
jgi:lipopolysaccharide export system permease protein